MNKEDPKEKYTNSCLMPVEEIFKEAEGVTLCIALLRYHHPGNSGLWQIILDYGAVVRSLYTKSDVCSVDKVQNLFIGFVGYYLKLWSYYEPPGIKPLSEHYIRLCHYFTRILIEGHIDVHHLLKWLCIRVSDNIRLKEPCTNQ